MAKEDYLGKHSKVLIFNKQNAATIENENEISQHKVFLRFMCNNNQEDITKMLSREREKEFAERKESEDEDTIESTDNHADAQQQYIDSSRRARHYPWIIFFLLHRFLHVSMHLVIMKFRIFRY